MNTKKLQEKVKFMGIESYGHFKVKITYRNKDYFFTTTNSLAIDRLQDGDEYGYNKFYTYKQALKALLEEGKKRAVFCIV